MKLSKTYTPKDYEGDIYSLWERREVFKPKYRGHKDSYSIVMPPPNANANLHIGYALTVALEDIPVRYHRMQGKAALLLPGADHAGFETQSVFEKRLASEGKSRFDYSREELYQQIWDFVQGNKANFESQMRALGASCDWSRFTFTLDDKVVATAYRTFKQMWDEELIYRGMRIVNYCTKHGTSFADVEVEHREEETSLWHIAYPLEDGSEEVVIATTRPETKMGQAALMVNPKDKRYKQFIGKNVLQPLVPDSPIPIIADDYVDMEFGTGVVTVTPGHDPNDFEVAERHGLETIELITAEGKISDNAPEQFRGLTVMEAREAAVAALEKSGNLKKIEPYTHSVGCCYKCGTVIEPLLREQWFVRMQPLARKAIAALEGNKIKFYPDAKKSQLITYLKGLKDWNISRQIAWGMPIPAFQNVEDPSDWIYEPQVDQEYIDRDGKRYQRDPDVFDTWFSSGQWPFVTLDFPDSESFEQFYPLSLMETGGEILYPWVSRMIMLGLYVTGKVPFTEVYIHGYVMAEDGSKMSKSIGNTVELLPVIETYGSDALRLGIIAGRTAAVNRGYDMRRVEEGRNFCNKLWNIARFVEEKVGDNHELRVEPKLESSADHWIMYKLQHTIAEISSDLQAYRFAEAYERLYHFVWDDVADWYIEASKSQLNPSTLAFVLEAVLKLAHPFAPFVTETIWQTLAWEKNSMLAVAPWPKAGKSDHGRIKEFEEIRNIVTETRFIISSLQLTGKTSLYYTKAPFIERNGTLIAGLAKLAGVKQVRDGQGMRLTKTTQDCWLDIDQHTAQRYLASLEAQRAKLHHVVEHLEERLSNKAYTSKAPKHIIDQTKSSLATEKTQLNNILSEIESFRKATRNLSE